MKPARQSNPEQSREWHRHIDAIGLGISVMAMGLSVGAIYERRSWAYAGILAGVTLAAAHWNPSSTEAV